MHIHINNKNNRVCLIIAHGLELSSKAKKFVKKQPTIFLRLVKAVILHK